MHNVSTVFLFKAFQLLLSSITQLIMG